MTTDGGATADGAADGAEDGAERPLPMRGRVVLDFGSALAGPVCATILGEFGADVIKVERPGHGDALRTYGPKIDDVPVWWMIEARNKRSITLDLRSVEGQALARRLIERCDVLVENFRPGTMAGWGLGYEDVARINPRVVYVSVSGFGQTGPYRSLASYDRVAQAMAGFTYLTGHPEMSPVRPGIGVTDYAAAMVAALGAMLALYERDASGTGSGRGQQVDVALYESLLRMYHYHLPVYERTGRVPERTGNMGEAMVPAECFASADAVWLMIAVGSDRTFLALAEAMGRPELATDERFAGNAARMGHHEEIHAIVRHWVGQYPAGTVLETLRAAGVPVGQLYTAADVHADPHFRERGSVTTVDDPRLGEVSVQGVVPRLVSTPGRIEHTGPTLGQHNNEIYRDMLGLSASELDHYQEKGVV
ncbi:MAG: formyl-CoA transferase [Micromonosporaceae bacterium]|jgi:succinyl-CoA--D-citramalate CoA-transferase|nr:formyl-CoA transferase [Micromonosporaceae bacterium]